MSDAVPPPKVNCDAAISVSMASLLDQGIIAYRPAGAGSALPRLKPGKVTESTGSRPEHGSTRSVNPLWIPNSVRQACWAEAAEAKPASTARRASVRCTVALSERLAVLPGTRRIIEERAGNAMPLEDSLFGDPRLY